MKYLKERQRVVGISVFVIIAILFCIAGCASEKEILLKKGCPPSYTDRYTEREPAIQITPGVYQIYLGTPISEISKIYPVKKPEEPVIALYRKFGLGDPDKEERINRELKRECYEIFERLPDNVKSIRLKTIEGLVYVIAIYYDPEYTRKISWEVFTYHAIHKYGPPTVNNSLLTMMNEYSFSWSDGVTELVIRKNGKLNKEKTIFSVESYHVFYTHVPTRNAVNAKKKQLDETETAPGIKKPSF